jgi:hypothetical protein
LLREKATHSAGPAIRTRLLAEYDKEINDEVLQLIGDNVDRVRAFQDRVANRIKEDVASGRLTVNRCPTCNRIVKTPLARQCLWCGHDWHRASGD